jgi:hypothetical protein
VFGRRRLVVAVLTTAAVVVTLGPQSSHGIVIQHKKHSTQHATGQVRPDAVGDAPSTGKTLVLSDTGGEGSGSQQSMVSGNGVWDVFSSADNLTGTNEKGQHNIFARNLKTGATVQLSGGVDGSPPASAGDGLQPSVSEDGRYVSYLVVPPTLSVTEAGAGTGKVTSDIGGIDCSPTCSARYDSGTTVTLSANPASGSSFDGWGGACSGTGTCTVTVNEDTSVTATFGAVPQHTLTVSKDEAHGTGSVTSSPSGINCGTTCSSSFAAGSTVTLDASPDAGFSVMSWGGIEGCPDFTTSCTVTLTADMTVTVTFGVVINFRNPKAAGSSAGSRASSGATPRGIAAPTAGTFADLTATGTQLVVCDRDPDNNGVFDETSGGKRNSCITVVMDAGLTAGRIDTADRPRLAGNGSSIVWTQQRSSDSSDTGAYYADLLDDGVLLPTVSSRPVPVALDPSVLPSRADCGGPTNTAISERQPVFTASGDAVVMAVTFPDDFGCTGIVETNLNATPTSTRVDWVPAECGGSGFMGDFPVFPATSPCAAASGDDSSVDSPSVDRYGYNVTFHFHSQQFTDFSAFASDDTHDWILLSNMFSASSSVVSRGNGTAKEPDGRFVDSHDGVISANSRYVAFETCDPNTSDGIDVGPCDVSPNPSQQIVVRDLFLDRDRFYSIQHRRAGALVTVHDPAVPPSGGCTATATEQCGSTDGLVDDISLSADGSWIGYNSTAADLVPNDHNGVADAFAHLWQPSVSLKTPDVGDVQIGDRKRVQVPVQVTGFGPIDFGKAQLSGPNANEFEIAGSTCENETLFTADTCDVAVNAAPRTLGTKRAVVSLNSPEFDAPVRVAVLTANAVPNATSSAAADNTRTSVSDAGGQSPTGGDESMISGDGRWQVFVSDSDLAGHTPIDPLDNGRSNIFVRDLADPERTLQISLHTDVAGKPGQPSRTVQVKGHPTGASPDGDSWDPSISSDGRFISFFTSATDIVPFPPLNQQQRPDFALVVCDRDPSDTKDAAGNPVLDLPRPGTQVPDYVCYVVQSGSEFSFVEGLALDSSSVPQVAGNGTRIAWVEDDYNNSQRVKVATISSSGGPLVAPNHVQYVPSSIPQFPAGSTRVSEEQSAQYDPVFTEDGNSVVFRAAGFDCECSGIVETDLSATPPTSRRFDVRPGGGGFLGDDQAGFMGAPAVSDDGNTVAFDFGISSGGVDFANMAAPSSDFNSVYVATANGPTITSRLESRDNDGNISAGQDPALSGDGRYLAFETSQPDESNATDPPGGDCFDNGGQGTTTCQIVARDLIKDNAFFAGDAPWTPSEIVSSRRLGSDGIARCPTDPLPVGRLCAGNGDSTNASIDETGSEIGFDSAATDIVSGDTNRTPCEGGPPKGCPATDSFVHTWRPSLTVVPSFDLGTVTVGGHRDRTYTVTSERPSGPTNFGAVSLGAGVISGRNSGDFTVRSDGCAGQTLNDGSTCTFVVRFAPTATGVRSANIAFPISKNSYPRHNPDDTISYDPALNEGLTGVGRAGGALVPAPTTLDFGKQLPLVPGHPKTITLTNTGGGPITVTDITVQDSTVPGASTDYTVNATDCLGVLQPGDSCVVTVTFTGHKSGNRGAQLVITDDQSPDPTLVTLTARVPKPKILINPGVVAPGRVTQITGTGFAPHRLVDVTLKGFGEHVSVRADGKGRFSVGLVLFHSTPEGPQTVVAQTHDADKSLGTDGPLLVASGTIDDLQLVTRH